MARSRATSPYWPSNRIPKIRNGVRISGSGSPPSRPVTTDNRQRWAVSMWHLVSAFEKRRPSSGGRSTLVPTAPGEPGGAGTTPARGGTSTITYHFQQVKLSLANKTVQASLPSGQREKIEEPSKSARRSKPRTAKPIKSDMSTLAVVTSSSYTRGRLEAWSDDDQRTTDGESRTRDFVVPAAPDSHQPLRRVGGTPR